MDAVRKGNPRLTRFDNSCFDGKYVTGGVTSEYLSNLEANRNEDAKDLRSRAEEAEVLELFQASS